MRVKSKTIITVAAVLIMLAMSLYAFSYEETAVNAATNVTLDSFTIESTAYYTQEMLFEYSAEKGYWYPTNRLFANLSVNGMPMAESTEPILKEDIEAIGVSAQSLTAGEQHITLKFNDNDDVVYSGETELSVTLLSEYLNANNFVGIKNNIYYGSTSDMMKYEKVALLQGDAITVLAEILMDWQGSANLLGPHFSFLAQYVAVLLDFAYTGWEETLLIRLDKISNIEQLSRIDEHGNVQPILGNIGADKWLDGEIQEEISLFNNLGDVINDIDALYEGLFGEDSDWISKNRIVSSYDSQTADMEKLCYNFITGELTLLENVDFSATQTGEVYTAEIDLDLNGGELSDLDIDGLTAQSSYISVAAVTAVPIALNYQNPASYEYHSEDNIRIPLVDYDGYISSHASHVSGNLYLLNEPFIYNNIYCAYIYIGGVNSGDDTTTIGEGEEKVYDAINQDIYALSEEFAPVNTENNVYRDISDVAPDIKAVYSAFFKMSDEGNFGHYRALPLLYCLDVVDGGSGNFQETLDYSLSPFLLTQGAEDGYTIGPSSWNGNATEVEAELLETLNQLNRSYNTTSDFALTGTPAAASFYQGYEIVVTGNYYDKTTGSLKVVPGESVIKDIGIDLVVQSGFDELGKHNYSIDHSSFFYKLIEICTYRETFPVHRPIVNQKYSVYLSNDAANWDYLFFESQSWPEGGPIDFYLFDDLIPNPLVYNITRFGDYVGTQFHPDNFDHIMIGSGYVIDSIDMGNIEKAVVVTDVSNGAVLGIRKGMVHLEVGNEMTYGNDMLSTLGIESINLYQEEIWHKGTRYVLKALPVLSLYRRAGVDWFPIQAGDFQFSQMIPFVGDYPNSLPFPVTPGISYKIGVDGGFFALHDEITGEYLILTTEFLLGNGDIEAFIASRYESSVTYSMDTTELNVLKGEIEYSLPRQEKIYGELDPVIDLSTHITGVRESDLEKVVFTRIFGEDAGDYPYSLSGVGDYVINSYYEISVASTAAMLAITQRDLPLQYSTNYYSFMPLEGENPVLKAEAHNAQPYFTLPYGIIPYANYNADDGEYYYYLNLRYSQPLPAVPAFSFTLKFELRFNALDVGEDGYIYSFTLINIDGQSANPSNLQNNVEISVQSGEHFRIVPRIVLIDLSSEDASITSKIFDGEQFVLEFSPGGLYYALDLAYGEEYERFVLKGYHKNEIDDLDMVNNVRAGEKWLHYTSSVFSEGQAENYDFRVHNVLKITISKRNYTFDTKATGDNNSKIYDGQVYQLPYEGYMAVNLVDNHYIAVSDLRFVTLSALANVTEAKLVLSTNDIVILDSSGVDFTSSYNLTGTEFGAAKILHRRLELTVNEVMYTTYDANRRYLDLSTGDLYSFDADSAVIIGNYEIVARNPIISYVESVRQTALSAIASAPNTNALLYRYNYQGNTYAEMKLSNSAAFQSGKYYAILDGLDGFAITSTSEMFNILSSIAAGTTTVSNGQFFYDGKIYNVEEIVPASFGWQKIYFVNNHSKALVTNTSEINNLLNAIESEAALLNPDGTFTYQEQEYAIVAANKASGIYHSDERYYYSVTNNVASFLNAENTGIYSYSQSASQYLRFTLSTAQSWFGTGRVYFFDEDASLIISDISVLYKIVQALSSENILPDGDNSFLFEGRNIRIIKIGTAQDTAVFEDSGEYYYYLDCSDVSFTVTDSALISALNALGGDSLLHNGRIYRKIKCSPTSGVFEPGEVYHYIQSGTIFLFLDSQVLIDGDEISGKLATETANYSERLPLVSDGTTYFFTVGTDTSYRYEVTTEFYVKIDRRGVSVNVLFAPDGSYTLEKIYDGERYRIDIDESRQDMVENRLANRGLLKDLGHYFIGYGESVSEKAGLPLISFSGDIFNASGTNINSNYYVTYAITNAEIHKRPVTVYPYADTGYASNDYDNDGIWDKYYDKTKFNIDISNNMVVYGSDIDLGDIGSLTGGLVFGHFVSGSNLVTADANVFTLDGNGNVLYVNEKFISKLLSFGTQFKIARLVAGVETDETANYDITLAESYVQILPKIVQVNLNKGYPLNGSMQFTYIGTEWIFPVTNLMLVDIYGNGAMLLGDNVVAGSEFITEEKNAGISNVLKPGYVYINSDESGIEDSVYSLNYDMNYQAEYSVEITKRNLTIDVNKVYTLSERTKVYDGLPYQIFMSNEMVTNTSAEFYTGLVELHSVAGVILTADEFYSALPKNLSYIWEEISDEMGANVIANYNISETGASSTISKRYLPIKINDNGITTMVYNAKPLKVYLTNEKANKEYDIDGIPINSVDNQGNPIGLIGLDFIAEGESSYRESAYALVRKYYLNNTTGNDSGVGEIVIQREGIGDNLAYNYEIVYVQDEVEIISRQVLVSVHNHENYSVIGAGAGIISGFVDYYNSVHFTVDFTYYHTFGVTYTGETYFGVGTSYGGLTNYGLVDGHNFVAGSRRTVSDNASETVLLTIDADAIVRDFEGVNVTANYTFTYVDSFYQIDKRPIHIDAVRGEASAIIDGEIGYYEHDYNRKFYILDLKNAMVVPDDGFQLPAGHSISEGFLTTESANVLRSAEGNVLLRPLVWGTQTLRIVNTSLPGNPDVTANYDIETTDSTYNFTQRYVMYTPRVVVIDIGSSDDGLQTYSKDYDGTPYDVNVTNRMALTILGSEYGLVGDVDQWGTVRNRDTITPNTGRLSTADKNVGEGKLLEVTRSAAINSPDGLNVTSNYDIYYYYNVQSLTVWNRIYNDGEIDNGYVEDNGHLPKATIRKKRVDISLPASDKLRKYFDTIKINIIVEYAAGASNPVSLEEGVIFTENLHRAISVVGLVPNEGLRLNVHSDSGDVGNQVGVFFQTDPGKDNYTEVINGSASNYTFNYVSGIAIILPRPIVIDTMDESGIISVAYSGNYSYVDVANSMVKTERDTSTTLLPVGEGLKLLGKGEDTHVISGTLRSMDANVGIHALSPKPAGNTDTSWVSVKVYSKEGVDLSAQYAIYYADNKIEITKKAVTIEIKDDNINIPRSKVYDGQPFVVQLANAPGVIGDLLAGHYITQGSIYTTDANVGAAKVAHCNTSAIRVSTLIEGTDIEADITNNYTFTYVPRTLEITRRGLIVEAAESVQKPVNGEIYVHLLERNYRFIGNDNDTGIVAGDKVKIVSYRVRNAINYNSGFPSAEADGESVMLTFYDLVIDNNNYKVITEKEITEKVGTTVSIYNLQQNGDYTRTETVINGSDEYIVRTVKGFEVNSSIKNAAPTISVSDKESSVRLFDSPGISYVYSGKSVNPLYYVTGLNGAAVSHVAYYAKMTSISGNELAELSDYIIDAENESAPTNAGLYRMRLTSNDPDYPTWEGYVYIRINPSKPTVTFTGSFEQTYGDVIDVTAIAYSAAGLNAPLEVTVTPQGNYIYPAAGTYNLSVAYNLAGENTNFVGVEASRTLVIRKRGLSVNFDPTREFTYDGSVHAFGATLDMTNVITQDKGIVTGNNIFLTIGGTASILKNAGTYNVTAALVNLPNYSIPEETIVITIHKRKLTISALVNGVDRATINEGSAFNISLFYEGFAQGESKADLMSPPTIPNVPKTEISNHKILPLGAESNNYAITYTAAYLTILSKKQPELVSADKIASITGEYGSYATLEVVQYNADITNPKYYEIYQHVDKNFSTTDLFKKYQPVLAYEFTINSDEEIANNVKLVKLKLTEKYADADSYMVVCVDAAGNTTLITAYSEGGYLMFSTTELGDYVVFTPKSSLSPEMATLLILAPIAVILIGAFLYFLFRRKY